MESEKANIKICGVELILEIISLNSCVLNIHRNKISVQCRGGSEKEGKRKRMHISNFPTSMSTQRRPRSNDNPIRKTILSDQISISKYHSPLKKTSGPWRNG